MSESCLHHVLVLTILATVSLPVEQGSSTSQGDDDHDDADDDVDVDVDDDDDLKS